MHSYIHACIHAYIYAWIHASMSTNVNKLRKCRQTCRKWAKIIIFVTPETGSSQVLWSRRGSQNQEKARELAFRHHMIHGHRPPVRPSVRPLVRPSARPSVRPSSGAPVGLPWGSRGGPWGSVGVPWGSARPSARDWTKVISSLGIVYIKFRAKSN